MANIKRIQKELSMIESNKDKQFIIKYNGDELFNLIAYIDGPVDTPYQGGVFKVDITLPSNYPFAAPECIVKTQIYHPNVSDNGNICLNVLKQWKPSITIKEVVENIISLLVSPNPDDSLSANIGQQYINNYDKFVQTAREYTSKYAH